MGDAIRMIRSMVLKVPHAINRRLQGAWSFYPLSLEEARKSILTDCEGLISDNRWEVETKEEFLALRRFISDDSVVCDFGIGIGRLSREILKEFPKVLVIGIDSSKPMLKYCKQFIPSTYYNRLQLLHFNKMRRIKANSVDVAFAIYVLQHIPASRFERSLKELRRVIRPGGLFYLLNLNLRCVNDRKRRGYDDGLPQLEVISKYFEEVQEVEYESTYMRKILETHFSKLFRPRKSSLADLK